MKRIILITFLIANLSCSAQKIILKATPMQNFDIKKFENNKNGNELTISESGVFTKQIETDTEYVESREKSDDPFVVYTKYYKGSGALKETFTLYFGFCIGERTEYDNQGDVTKTTNCDKDYRFSLYDLAKKMSHEYNIDILHRNQLFIVARGQDSATYYYQITIPLGKTLKSDAKVVHINGMNGATMSEKIIPYIQ